tara:strand:+ start:4597 stop:4728 length:132 start_codon:yes stop_codon:yes gene_type:complete
MMEETVENQLEQVNRLTHSALKDAGIELMTAGRPAILTEPSTG